MGGLGNQGAMSVVAALGKHFLAKPSLILLIVSIHHNQFILSEHWRAQIKQENFWRPNLKFESLNLFKNKQYGRLRPQPTHRR
jgi:hypothetical protein